MLIYIHTYKHTLHLLQKSQFGHQNIHQLISYKIFKNFISEAEKKLLLIKHYSNSNFSNIDYKNLLKFVLFGFFDQQLQLWQCCQYNFKEKPI